MKKIDHQRVFSCPCEAYNEMLKAKVASLFSEGFKIWLQDQTPTEEPNKVLVFERGTILEKGTVVGHISGLGFEETNDDNVICKIDITDPTFNDRLYKGQVNMDDIGLGVKSEDKHLLKRKQKSPKGVKMSEARQHKEVVLSMMLNTIRYREARIPALEKVIERFEEATDPESIKATADLKEKLGRTKLRLSEILQAAQWLLDVWEPQMGDNDSVDELMKMLRG